MRFGLPFGALFFAESRPRFRAVRARLLFRPTFRLRLLRRDLKRWGATSGCLSPCQSCGMARGFYSANPAHAPVSFFLFKGFPRLARTVPPFPQPFSRDRGRLPLMRLSATTVRNRSRRASECDARTDWLFRFRGAPPFIRFFAYSCQATEASRVLAAFGHRNDRT
jgi:hypothetical protein